MIQKESIETYDKSITHAEFSEKYFHGRKPVLLSGGMKNSFQCKNWSPDYLKKRMGKRKVKVNHSKDGVYGHQEGVTTTYEMVFEEFVPLLNEENANSHSYYLQQTSIYPHFPEILPEVEFPYLLSDTDVKLSTNLWFGGTNCVSPLHFDVSHNFLLQVYGKKNIHIIPPDDSPYIYADPDPKFKNLSLVSLEQPDNEKFPLFNKARQFFCTLYPGDVLYLPPSWWHHVRSVGTSISINYWWNRFEILEGAGMEKLDMESIKKIVNYFLENGVSINCRDTKGETVLLNAVRRGYMNIVEALLQLGADPNMRSHVFRPGGTAIHLAVENGYSEMVIKLIKYQANLELKDNKGFTALDICMEKKHYHLLPILKKTT